MFTSQRADNDNRLLATDNSMFLFFFCSITIAVFSHPMQCVDASSYSKKNFKKSAFNVPQKSQNGFRFVNLTLRLIHLRVSCAVTNNNFMCWAEVFLSLSQARARDRSLLFLVIHKNIICISKKKKKKICNWKLHFWWWWKMCLPRFLVVLLFRLQFFSKIWFHLIVDLFISLSFASFNARQWAHTFRHTHTQKVFTQMNRHVCLFFGCLMKRKTLKNVSKFARFNEILWAVQFQMQQVFLVPFTQPKNEHVNVYC